MVLNEAVLHLPLYEKLYKRISVICSYIQIEAHCMIDEICTEACKMFPKKCSLKTERSRAIIAYCINNVLSKQKCPRPIDVISNICDISPKKIYALEAEFGSMHYSLPLHFVNILCQMLFLPFEFTKKVAHCVANTHTIPGKHMPETKVAACILKVAHRYKSIKSNCEDPTICKILSKINTQTVCSTIGITHKNLVLTLRAFNNSWDKAVLDTYEKQYGNTLTLSLREKLFQ